MNWARIHPMIVNWPGGGSPPVFNLSADVNGTAVIELAWDSQALSAPAPYENSLRYYASNLDFNANIPNADGAVRQVSVPAQTIQLTGNQATWIMPQPLWDAYAAGDYFISTGRRSTFNLPLSENRFHSSRTAGFRTKQ